jgi:hypothetical protein
MSKKQKQFELLSAYIDQELSDVEKVEVEKLLVESEELRKKLEELKQIKHFTTQFKKLPESPYLESKIMAELEKGQTGYQRLRKWTPAIAFGVVTILIMVFLKINPNVISDFWENQKSVIAGFYKENLQPVLYAADLTNDDIFNFAFNNELPLSNSRDQYLHLGYDDAGKEYFEIRPAKELTEESGYNKFVNALKLDEKEKQLVDSIIGSYAEELESQVLINDKNTLAINSKLWNYRKAIFSDLLIVAENLNKKEFSKFVPHGVSADDKIRVVNAVHKLKSATENQYIFCTPDSVFSAAYEFKIKKSDVDLKNLEREVEKDEEILKQITINLKFDSTWKKLDKNGNVEKSFRIEVDSNICRVDINNIDIPKIHIPDFDSINYLIEEATENIHFYTYNIPKVEHVKEGVKFDFYDGDSIHSFEFKYEYLNMDSVIKSEFKILDSIQSNQRVWVQYFDDSVLSKYQIDKDYLFRHYDQESIKEQMMQLQEQLKQFREEMYEKGLEGKRDRIIKIK